MSSINSSWSTEELERRTKLYENTRGRFDIGKIYVSSAADYTFLGLIGLMGVIAVGVSLIYWAGGGLWSHGYFAVLSALEIYPVILLILLSLYVLGHRYDETIKYFQYKRELKRRNSTHEQATESIAFS